MDGDGGEAQARASAPLVPSGFLVMVAPPRPQQPTVLVVEDDETTRNTMTRILVREGYLALTAESGHDALGTLRAPLAPIDVVVLDVHLPDVSGIDLCARIREMHPNLPVVVCTGEAEPAEAARLLELGVHRYFLKPIAADELLATVEAALLR
jgi:DNA-binding response OmpR family regulator